jgi:hypothetical protein
MTSLVRLFVRLSCVFLLLGAPANALAQSAGTITKAEARSLPERTVRARVMAQLRAILSEDHFTRGRPPTRQLDDLSFRTRARAVEVPGLCQLDQLSVTFDSGRSEKGDENTPVSVDGFTASHFFHFVDPPTGDHDEIVDYDHRPPESRCRGLDFWKDDFFLAENAGVATDGYLVAHRAMDAIVAGTPSFTVTCDTYPNEASRSCAEVMREVRGESLSRITECDAGGLSLDACYVIDIGDRSLRITATRYGRGPGSPPPLTLLTFDMQSMVVIADSRID